MGDSQNKDFIITCLISAGIGALLVWCWQYFVYILLGIGIVRVLHNIKYFIDTVREYLLLKQYDLQARYGKGSYALITGGGNGIGLGFAQNLAEQGFNLILIDFDAKALEKAKKDLESSGITVEIIQSDMTKLRTAEDFKNLLGSYMDYDISLLVNNVGVNSTLEFHDVHPQLLSNMLQLNCISYVALTSLLYQKLAKRNKKSGIVAMSSMYGYHPLYLFLPYTMTKSFEHFLIQGLDYEGEKNLDLLSVHPGFVSTDMAMNREAFDTISPHLCAKRSLRALGHQTQTETALIARITTDYISKSLWETSSWLMYKVFQVLIVDLLDGQEILNAQEREKQRCSKL